MNGNEKRRAEEAAKLAQKAAKAEAQRVAQKEKLAAIERDKDQKLRIQDEVTRKKNDQAAERARKEEEKLFAEAKKKALEQEKMALVAEKKKKDQIKAKEDAATAAEIEKQKQRKVAARKADAERMWTPNDLAELRGEFIKYDTNKDGTIPASNVATICETLGETLNNSALQLLLTEMKKDIAERVEWVNFLNALVSKREAARRNGVGLLEKFGLKKAAAEKKKNARIKAEEDAAKLEEIEKKKQRKVAARKADAERMWTPNDLAELRGEFIKYDTNKDGTIPASNVATICETLGETLNNSALQLLLTEMKKDIAERVEWVNFLNALVSKREAARRNGVGLLEKFGLKKAAAEKKKNARIKAEEDSVKEEAAKAEIVRQKASEVARKKKETEKLAIVKRNEEIEKRAKEEKRKIEARKQEEERKKAESVKNKAAEARKREAAIRKKKAAAVKDKAKEREEKKAQAERRKKLKKQHLLAQDAMKAQIVKEKGKGNFDKAKILKAQLKELEKTQAKELKNPVRPAAGTGKSKAPGSGRKLYNPNK